MHVRTGLVIGGMTAVAASVAVVTAVALANTAALADSPGTSIASKRVVVPAAGAPSAAPQPAQATTPDALTPSAEPEVVQAPEPVEVVPPPSISPRTPATAAPENAPAAPAPPAATGDIDSAIAAAKAAGTWDALRTWADSHGWPSGRLDALIARLEREITDQNPLDEGNKSGGANSSSESNDSTAQRQGVVQAPAPGHKVPAQQRPQKQQKESGQQWTGQKPPAHAGSNVGNGNGAGNDGKKDQSRNSPDRRD
ncbi:hypothetical protein J2Y46_003662 [Microbacterium sp. BE35]|uniref:hypothetical protein n=1 Tax=Microbacterium sp. BE35 TaxID=2817773 RepID=UPI00285D9532|nr:hypothetical protein [Microbacterium sp. BE35]MDR7190804.1 hypothetical protein [Microbacterium sp. BE35]